jgi:hypothetical protein
VAFLYHRRPPDMRGETLFPLNAFQTINPELYARERGRYAGREAVLDFRIPLLDVLWNDAVHLSPVHPSRLAAAWRSAGLWTSVWERDYFKIPVARVAELPSVWFASEAFWVNNSPNEDVPLAPPLDEFSWFDPSTYQELNDVPASYHAYLERQKRRGRPPLQFPKIPHVLVGGPIDVAGVSLVRADAPSNPSH